MHKPASVNNLIDILSKVKDKSKPVIVNIGFNNYDITQYIDDKNQLTLSLKIVNKRNEPDKDEPRKSS